MPAARMPAWERRRAGCGRYGHAALACRGCRFQPGHGRSVGRGADRQTELRPRGLPRNRFNNRIAEMPKFLDYAEVLG